MRARVRQALCLGEGLLLTVSPLLSPQPTASPQQSPGLSELQTRSPPLSHNPDGFRFSSDKSPQPAHCASRLCQAWPPPTSTSSLVLSPAPFSQDPPVCWVHLAPGWLFVICVYQLHGHLLDPVPFPVLLMQPSSQLEVICHLLIPDCWLMCTVLCPPSLFVHRGSNSSMTICRETCRDRTGSSGHNWCLYKKSKKCQKSFSMDTLRKGQWPHREEVATTAKKHPRKQLKLLASSLWANEVLLFKAPGLRH